MSAYSIYASFAQAEAAYRRERIASVSRRHSVSAADVPVRTRRRSLGRLHRSRTAAGSRTAAVTVGSGRLAR